MKWMNKRFGDAIYFNPSHGLKNDEEYEFIMMEDITPGFKYAYPAGLKKGSSSGSKFTNGDTVFARITPCLENGKIAEVKGLQKGVGIGSTEFFVFRNKEGITDSKFVYYLALTREVRQIAEKSMQGASGRQRALREPIENYEFSLPPLPIQRRIASILNAYDDLIENNLRRIKLLEEAARCEYKLVMEDSESLSTKLCDVATINDRTLSSKFEGTIKYIDIASVEVGHISDLQEYKFSEAPGRAKRIVRHGDTIWSCVRPNRKSYAYIIEPKENTIASTGFAVITPKSIGSAFLYQSLITDEYVKYLESHATGAAYPAVTSKDFEASVINVPKDLNKLAAFEKRVSPYHTLINRLQSQNAQLRQARDILLPKLMSGEIDVAGDITKSTMIEMPNYETMAAEDEVNYVKSMKVSH